jgi:hypothetical protein
MNTVFKSFQAQSYSAGTEIFITSQQHKDLPNLQIKTDIRNVTVVYIEKLQLLQSSPVQNLSSFKTRQPMNLDFNSKITCFKKLSCA